jgi:hypothetical protein
MTPLSFLPSHTETLRQQHAAEVRPGRNPADSAELIGQRNGRIVCVDVLPPNAKRQSHAIAVCDCGKASSPRVSDFAKGKVGSCKCLKTERFKAHQRRRAENLNHETVRDIFIDSARTGNWDGADLVVARRHDVPSHCIRAVVDLHHERLLAKYGDTVRENRLISRRNLDKTLHASEYDWLVKHTPWPYEDPIEIDWNELSDDERLQFASFAPVELPMAARHSDAIRDCWPHLLMSKSPKGSNIARIPRKVWHRL